MYCLAFDFLMVWLAVFLTTGLCQDTCRVQDGKPGQAGIPGRDGLPGQKGEKGNSAPLVDFKMVRGNKGDSGDKGLPGDMGKKGFGGEVGQMGLPGSPGLKGPPGDGEISSGNRRSAFSVLCTSKGNSAQKSSVIFNKALIDINNEFNLQRGDFTCKMPGVYYFVFHATSKVNLCLAIMSDAFDENGKGFCDYGRKEQVLSGGVVLNLAKNQKVWLKAFKEDQDLGTDSFHFQGESIVFNGFMIFSD